MSKRTDGGPAQPMRYMAGGDYGDGQAMMDLQRSAPMSASPQPQTRAQSAGQQAGPSVVPLGAPTQRPDEPVTAGSPMGDGPGPEALASSPVDPATEWGKFKSYLPMLTEAANQPGVSPNFVQFVRYLRDK